MSNTAESRIAIIGMACRLPGGVDSPDSLWSLLAEGRDGWTEVPKDRWDWKSFYHKDPDAKEATNFSHAHFLQQDMEAFDARFFGIPASEAAAMDPQQRLLLEVTYEAVENAGLPLESLRGSNTSVHMALSERGYDRMGYKDMSSLHRLHIVGTGEAILANRISYFMDLRGSSNSLDTGCSGGLVAVHQACRSLRADESTLALAGASQLYVSPDQSIAMSALTNKHGRCYTFDDRGEGYGRGEGVGVLVLKRLDRALADGDPIHAVVVNADCNQDGKTAGLLLPNAEAQAALARSVYKSAGLDPLETLYVEAHGTGTVAGDNAEVSSISRVFGREAGRASNLPIGSAKANLGHTEAVSGIAGMIKAAMVLKKNQIPPQLNFINPKPTLRLEERGIIIPLKLISLTPEGHSGPRRVSVNSFGYGGTNAHAILEAYEHPPPTTNGTSYNHVESKGDTHLRLITLSANSEASLGSWIPKLRQWLGSNQGRTTSLADLAYTLNTRRSKFAWRCSLITNTVESLADMLTDSKVTPVKAAKEVGVAFIFTGQGAQWFAMGQELLKGSQIFASSIASCNQVIKCLGCDWDLVEELSRDKTTSRLGESRLSQPCTTAIQIALVDLVEAWGLRPEAVCGHSSGEIAAAYAAGALSLNAAMETAYRRGIYSFEAKGLNAATGAMLAVGEGETTIQERIRNLDPKGGKVTVACVNSPESCTVSGDLAAILELQGILDGASIFNRRLQVDTAYHSHHMQAVASSYLSSLGSLSHGPPKDHVAFYSSVTGSRKQSDFGPAYWVSNLVSQVKFSAATHLVAEHLSTSGSPTNLLVEVGPHSALLGPLRQSLSKWKSTNTGAPLSYAYSSCLVRGTDAMASVLTLAGKAFEIGYPVQLDVLADLNSFAAGSPSQHHIVENLPTYPWDHSSTYWTESRLSKARRFRPFPYHDLLGLLDETSSTKEPRWRHQLSLDTLPWLRDHVIDGFVIFPGAGYLAMVMEAMTQLFHIRKTAGHFRDVSFRDVQFSKPVVIVEDGMKGSQQVELQLTVSPSRKHAGSSWEYFRVLSYDKQTESWMENCSGLVSSGVETAEARAQTHDEVIGTTEDGVGHLTKAAAVKMMQDIQTNSTIQIDPEIIYHELTASGMAYGPSFRGMKEIQAGPSRGLARIVIADIESNMPGQHMQPHIFHPSTLDGMLQLITLVFRRECMAAPVMPLSVGEMCVSADMNHTPGAEILVAIRLTPESRQVGSGEFCAYQKQSDGTLLAVATGSGVRLQVIGKTDANNSSTQKASYRVAWGPDVDHISQDKFMKHVARLRASDISSDGASSKPSIDDQLYLNEQVATIFNRRALKQLRKAGSPKACNTHLNKLLDWMLRWDQSESAHFLETITSDEDEARLIVQASENNIGGFILSRMGPHYFDILTGKADPLELLVEDDLLGRLYSEYMLFRNHYAQMEEYVHSLVHKYPNMKILEIGAGTGGATMPLLQKIERRGRLLLDKYTYTDISSGFFERARQKFGRWTGQMEFQTLDISADPLPQGYAAESFDLIIAANVLHATPRMDVTLGNVRRLLKPGGRLVLMELTQVAAAHTFIVGALEGWWMSEDGRKDGPLLTVPEWDGLLRHTGFTGTNLVIPAHTGRSRDISSFMVTRGEATWEGSTVNENKELPSLSGSMESRVLLGHPDSSQEVLGAEICASLSERGVGCSQEVWSEATTADANQLFIVIDSAEYPLLLDPTPETFARVKQLLLHGRNILWVSFHQAQPTAETAAWKNMVNGMARVVRHEDPALRLVTVDIQDKVGFTSSTTHLQCITQILADVAMSSFWPLLESTRSAEVEYTIRGGELRILRVVPDDDFARFRECHSSSSSSSSNPNSGHTASPSSSLVECKYLDRDRPLVFDVQIPGLLNTIRFVDNDEMRQPLSPDHIEVQVRAHGLNFKDVLIALGQMPPGTGMAGVAAGVVTSVGSNSQSLWQPGDRVIGLFVAPYGNPVRVISKGAIRIPASVTFVDAAAIALVYYTAWYGLVHAARLEKGQTVLVNAASGGVGQAAIQIAKHIGAEIYATVSSAAKRQLIQDQYGIPESHIFSSNSRHLKKHIMNATRGNGVDVVLNSLSGQMLIDSWDCVAPFGTFVEIGKTDIHGRSQLNMANFEKHITFASVDVGRLYLRRPDAAARMLGEIFGLVDQGVLKSPYPVTTYPMTQIEDAFRVMAARKHVGKVVLTADEQTMVRATRPKPPALHLHREGTYIVSGGVGDIGKKICRYLAKKGAGHIVALTRRDVQTQERVPLEEALSQLGGKLHIVRCDISSEKAVQAVVQDIAGLPPVRGIIQSALVLQDHPMEYMEIEDWKTAVRPKVQGTLNMQKHFCSPETTDFFVMLSSVNSMIGLVSQSNYAAGNAFQDAFSQTMNAQGTAAGGSVTHYTTINVGAVEGSEQITRAIAAGTNIPTSVTFDDVLATLEYAMGSQARVDHAAQLLMAFERDTLEDALGPTILGDRMFDHVLSQRRQGTGATNGVAAANQPTAAAEARAAASIHEAEDIVRHALVDKFAAFLGDDVVDDQPIAALGVDSLVSIELKNWIKHTFATPLQTFELSAAPSIIALAHLVVSRMELKCNVTKLDSDFTNRDQDPNGVASGNLQKSSNSRNGNLNGANGHQATGGIKAKTPSHGWECCKHSETLPVQPLPDLDDSLDFWLEANAHLYPAEQLAIIQQDMNSLRTPDGPARRVLADLFSSHALDDDPGHGWLNDVLTDARFLCQRDPLAPYHSIMASHREVDGGRGPQRQHAQAERAALIAQATLAFKRAMEAGTVEPLEVAGRPECTWRWGWLFHSVRVPRVGCDEMVRYNDEAGAAGTGEHIAVLRQGRVFKVVLEDEKGRDVSFAHLQRTFEAIVARVADDEVWSGILTTDDRDTWAETRRKLEGISSGNIEYFHVIDTAMFVLCLDNGSPETPEERARQGYLGDGFNRWFDKVLQFYVHANGLSGFITEHGAIDGTTPARLQELIGKAIEEQSARGKRDMPNGDHKLDDIVLEEAVLQTTPEIESHMRVLRRRYLEYTSPKATTYVQEHLDEFGTDFLMRRRVAVKGVIDLTFQLALHLFFGRTLPAWEPVSAAHYHTGRSDGVQRATPAVATFCEAVAATYQDDSKLQQQQPPDNDVPSILLPRQNDRQQQPLGTLLTAATKQMHAGMREMTNGRSYLRVMELLNWLWPADTPKPRFLSEHIFFGRPFPPVFVQSNAVEAGMPIEDLVHVMPSPEGVWAIMLPEENRIRVCVTAGTPERAAAFIRQLHRAAEIMRGIVESM